ncbi:hypothetical protein DY000_02007743 [Brassica cretica]|uniref:Uncharacterized protein n=1 Tax=Brassica cretica TaxID=69181 RepID=A0ABQ7BTL4_BRACR|nr:hypothetical protein DY000_02007743 [Brassica cretica]
MPSSTRSNKESQLLFSPDPASLERSIRKEARSSSIDNNTYSSLDFVQLPSTQTLVPSTDTRSPPSTEDTHLPSTDIIHPTSIDTPSQKLIDTKPRDMVATLILVRDDNGDLHDQDGAAIPEGRSTSDFKHRSTHTSPNRSTRTPEDRPMTPAESSTSCNAMTILTHEEFAAKHRHPPNPDNVRIARRDVTPSIDNRMPKPKPKPSKNPPETVRTPSDDGEDPMEEDRVLRRRSYWKNPKEKKGKSGETSEEGD